MKLDTINNFKKALELAAKERNLTIDESSFEFTDKEAIVKAFDDKSIEVLITVRQEAWAAGYYVELRYTHKWSEIDVKVKGLVSGY